MFTEEQVRNKLTNHWSNIFKNGWWDNPEAKGRTGPKIGIGKGEAWYEMYRAICDSGIEINTLLNIGVGPHINRDNPSIKWLSLYETMFPSISKWVNLELEEEAANRIKGCNKEFKKYFSEVVVGDIKNISASQFSTPIDVLLWSHGPEHVYRYEWKDVFERLDRVAKIILIGLPWGSGYNNEPTHFSPSVRRGEMEEFGFEMRYVGVEDTRFANMYGWKINA